jgi:hypothetical protein
MPKRLSAPRHLGRGLVNLLVKAEAGKKVAQVTEATMAQHVVVAEVGIDCQRIGPCLVVAVPDDIDVSGPLPDESLSHPVASFTDEEQAYAEQDRLDAGLKSK